MHVVADCEQSESHSLPSVRVKVTSQGESGKMAFQNERNEEMGTKSTKGTSVSLPISTC